MDADSSLDLMFHKIFAFNFIFSRVRVFVLLMNGTSGEASKRMDYKNCSTKGLAFCTSLSLMEIFCLIDFCGGKERTRMEWAELGRVKIWEKFS